MNFSKDSVINNTFFFEGKDKVSRHTDDGDDGDRPLTISAKFVSINLGEY